MNEIVEFPCVFQANVCILFLFEYVSIFFICPNIPLFKYATGQRTLAIIGETLEKTPVDRLDLNFFVGTFES